MGNNFSIEYVACRNGSQVARMINHLANRNYCWSSNNQPIRKDNDMYLSVFALYHVTRTVQIIPFIATDRIKRSGGRVVEFGEWYAKQKSTSSSDRVH